jgi:1,6-anhydro-N-acetylmuramate kinase
MAVRTVSGLPISFPDTTGVAEPMVGGVLAQPSEFPPDDDGAARFP